jgi:hypothetical protein
MKTYKTLLFVTGILVGCGEAADTASEAVNVATTSEGTVGFSGAADDKVCTVQDTDDGAQIQCEDGTVAKVLDGEDGLDGVDGLDGINGANGSNGSDGMDCTVVDTSLGARIVCEDGTVAELYDGNDGTNGADGSDGAASTASSLKVSVNGDVIADVLMAINAYEYYIKDAEDNIYYYSHRREAGMLSNVVHLRSHAGHTWFRKISDTTTTKYYNSKRSQGGSNCANETNFYDFFDLEYFTPPFTADYDYHNAFSGNANITN